MKRLAATLLSVVLSPAPAFAQDPKVPPAHDAAGNPVALAGAGIDYTDAALTTRLARDGEGNIVGWDFVDDDIRPYGRDPAANALAKRLLVNPGVKLVPVRIAAGDPTGPARAAAFTAQTPARLLVVPLSSARKEDWDVFAKAAQHFKDILIVVPAAPGATAPFPAALKLDNVLSVALPADGDAVADVAMAAPADAAAPPATPEEAAVVLAAALATCHAAALGSGDGKTRKAAVLAKIAQPRSSSRVPAVPLCP